MIDRPFDTTTATKFNNVNNINNMNRNMGLPSRASVKRQPKNERVISEHIVVPEFNEVCTATGVVEAFYTIGIYIYIYWYI